MAAPRPEAVGPSGETRATSKGSCPAAVLRPEMGDDPPTPDPVREGARLFNEGHFFEAHEVWEDAWHEARGEPRRFLQGLIQIAAGLHHFQNGNVRSAIALLGRGAEKVRGYPSAYMGLEAGELVHRIDRVRAELERAERGEPAREAVELPPLRFS